MATIISLELFKLRKVFGTTEEWLYLLTKVEEDKAQCCHEDESRKGSARRSYLRLAWVKLRKDSCLMEERFALRPFEIMICSTI